MPDKNIPAALSSNAKTILEQRYLMKDDEGEPIETPEQLFHRVADAVAEGEDAERRKVWADLFYQSMASLKFLPNSPTLVNAGTGGRGCLSACFVVSPDDNMGSIMKVASDAAMIEKWGGGIGFGLSALRPARDKIATTHGEACGPIQVMKLYSAVGATLTQGSFRLGAHMGQLIITHPDVQEFIHCKDGDDTLQNFNITVQITDEFMEAVRDDKEWTFVNPRDIGEGPLNSPAGTVRARDLWNEICESAWKTGDPGVAFMDRIWDTQPNPQMGDIRSSNPCVTGDTLVYTGEGLVSIRDLAGQTPTLSLDSRSGEVFSFASKVWKSGVKPVFQLMTKEGYTLKLTADHEVFTTNGKVAAKDLKAGDKIRLLDHKGRFGSEGTPELGMVLGWLTGDGHIDPVSAVLSFYGEDIEEVGDLLSAATQAVVAGTGLNPNRSYPTKLHLTPAGQGMVNSIRLKRLAEEYGLKNGDWHHVPDVIFKGTEETQRAYLQALFGADGTVSGLSAEKGLSVRLNSSYPKLLQDVQRLILNFGIASRIYFRRDSRVSNLPDGKGGVKEYETMPNYELVISKSNVQRFAGEIGFLTERKNVTLAERISTYKKGFYAERFLATFVRLEELGEEEVFDLTEPITHSFVANGLVVSNCGEEWLENYGNCCLASVNCDRHTKMVNGNVEIDFEALEQTIRIAVRFLNDVIEINQFPLQKLREVNLATRRIGLGVMGWADLLVRLGIPYDSPEAFTLAERVGKFLVDTAWDESAEIARERGPFSEYENSALKAKGMPPVRNSSVFTIAPTGTISRLADCSSGIEPHFASAWWSNVLWEGAEGGSAAERLLDAPRSVREALKGSLGSDDRATAVLERIAENPSDAEAILTAEGVDAGVFRNAMEISAEAHIRMQAAWQKNVTNSVSKTINLPNDATIEDVANAYWLAWETGCKAITVYRDGSKAVQVLETGSKKEESEPVASVNGARKRPATMLGITQKIPTGHGKMYVTLNFDENWKPYELFTAIGKAGGSEPAHLEGLSRMISMNLRSGESPENIIRELEGITSEPVTDDGVVIKSAEDGIAHVLTMHANGPNRPLANARQRNGTQVFAGNGLSCPKCPGQLIMQEGCESCLNCGYSKCE